MYNLEVQSDGSLHVRQGAVIVCSVPVQDAMQLAALIMQANPQTFTDLWNAGKLGLSNMQAVKPNIIGTR